MNKLRISDDLSLPLEAVTSTFCIVGIRGSGKSTTAVDMAEEMLKAKQQIVVMDPKDDWNGLRSSADGKDMGFPVTILGGAKQDAPLESSGGKLVADLVVEDGLSCILSTRHFSDGQRVQFVYDFALRLYQTAKGVPLHLFIDEADQFAPQSPMRDEARMLGLVQRLLKQGRTAGIGASLITQRPATLNKNVMTQCETLIAMRTIGLQDRKAVEEWVKAWSKTKAEHDSTMAMLPTFKAGQGLLWSPAWLELYQVVQFRQAETFDSRKTPKVGERKVEPKILAPVDLKALSERMAATIERAKADDPRELRKQIAELKKINLAHATQAPDASIVARLSEQVAAWKERAENLEGLLKQNQALVVKVSKALAAVPVAELMEVRWNFAQSGGRAAASVGPNGSANRTSIMSEIISRESGRADKGAVPEMRKPRERFVDSNPTSPATLPIGERKILTALIQYERSVPRESLTVITGYKRSSRDAYIQRLREKGLVATDGGNVVATEAGTAALPDVEPLPTGNALRDWHLQRLPIGESAILSELIEAYPKAIDRESLSESTNYKRSSRDAYIQRLFARMLIERDSGGIRAVDGLFD